jgi:hypothetical protein
MATIRAGRKKSFAFDIGNALSSYPHVRRSGKINPLDHHDRRERWIKPNPANLNAAWMKDLAQVHLRGRRRGENGANECSGNSG